MKKLLMVLFLVVMLGACGDPEPEDTFYYEFNVSVDTVEINGTWSDPGIVFFVNTVEYAETSSDVVDTTTLGQKLVNYSVTVEGVTFNATRYIEVVDTTKPVITLLIGLDTLIVGADAWVDGGATVIDNLDLELEITVTGTVDTATVGSYDISYTATDLSGNVEVLVRTVHVIAE